MVYGLGLGLGLGFRVTGYSYGLIVGLGVTGLELVLEGWNLN